MDPDIRFRLMNVSNLEYAKNVIDVIQSLNLDVKVSGDVFVDFSCPVVGIELRGMFKHILPMNRNLLKEEFKKFYSINVHFEQIQYDAETYKASVTLRTDEILINGKESTLKFTFIHS